jgi:transcriptional regulator of arginine metabolism
MPKLSRQKLILQLVRQNNISNQEQLRKVLSRHGYAVTQATLSRDIHELGLVKTTEGYSAASGEGALENAPRPALRMVREFVTEVREAQNLLVVRTAAGSAQPVAAALDAQGWVEVVGTVGGDDTILVICENRRGAHKLAIRLRGMAK